MATPIGRAAPAALTPAESKYPLASRPEVVDVTPDMAGDWLEYRTWDKNRRTSPAKVASWTEVIKRGGWKLTHQGFAFDSRGYILDGQHRLKAIAASGETVPVWVFPDMPRDTFDVIDTGYARAATQFMTSVAPTMAAGAVRYIAAVLDPEFKGVYRARMPLHDVLEMHRQWPEVENWALATWGARSVAAIPPSPVLAIVAMSERGGVKKEIISEFLSGLKSGAIGDPHDPRLALRNRFIKDHKALNRTHAYALLVKGFNLYVTGERKARLLYTEGDHIPLPYGITWNGERLRRGSEAA
jgi:hypothetical protein